MESKSDDFSIKKIIFNDPLGYAIVYYNPVGPNALILPQREEKCEHERHRVVTRLEESLEDKLHEEIEAMVRRKEREDAATEITKISQKVDELFHDVQAADLKEREILNWRVKALIKGKTADQICDILVNDVLQHTKPVPRPKSDFELKRKPVNGRIRRSIPDVVVPREPKIYEKITKLLAEDQLSNIHVKMYTRTLEKIQDDIQILKRRCTQKISFPN